MCHVKDLLFVDQHGIIVSNYIAYKAKSNETFLDSFVIWINLVQFNDEFSFYSLNRKYIITCYILSLSS